uniref:Ubiquitin-like protein 3 n=1 Tax=Cyanistes caeruleus TaxID=156563 RepID=A0A8C0VU30_CYACU
MIISQCLYLQMCCLVNFKVSFKKAHNQQTSTKINLRLILVSGKTKEFLFSPNDSAADIAKHVYDNWPMDWEEEQVSSPNILRLIYQGRFLHGNVTLGALKLPFGKTTVMHLVARETLPEPNSQGRLGTRGVSYSSNGKVVRSLTGFLSIS